MEPILFESAWVFQRSFIKEMNMNILKKSSLTALARLLIMAACLVFVSVTLYQWYRSKAIGGFYKPAQRFNGRDYPLLLQPHWAEDQPDLETLTFKKDFLLRFLETGKIYFHVNKYREDVGGVADGVTLEIYADDRLIASKLENPYAFQSDLYADDNRYHTVEFEFEIPSATRELKIRVNANENTLKDHVWLEQVFVTKPNLSEKAILLLFGVLFLVLLLNGTRPVTKK
jgi:hypothetical protein